MTTSIRQPGIFLDCVHLNFIVSYLCGSLRTKTGASGQLLQDLFEWGFGKTPPRLPGGGEGKRRRIGPDKLIALISVFHCWMVLCMAGVLRSDSVRTLMLKHIFVGIPLPNPDQPVDCVPLIFMVQMKG